MKKKVGLAEFRARTSELLQQVEQTGQPLVLTDRGRAVGVLSPVASPPPAPPPPRRPVEEEFGLHHLSPLEFDEEAMVGVFPLAVADGVMYERMGVRFAVCPRCAGRGRVVPRDLQGRPVPEEAPVPCDRCQEKRVVPVIDLDTVYDGYYGYLRDRARDLDRVEEELRPYFVTPQPPPEDDLLI